MIRKRIFPSPRNREFRDRGQEILRIEALSDAVFAFSVSLLVAALEVPQTFEELKLIAQGAIPFFATVAMIFLFWYRQYLFFRRYGVNDFTTIVLNLMYLAVILFYVYPLKFLFSLLISNWTGIDLFTKATEKGLTVLKEEDFSQLIILFSIGYGLVWLIIYFMQLHVLRLKHRLDLTPYELLFTRSETRAALWNVIIGFLSLVMAWLGNLVVASLLFLLIPIAMQLNSYLFKKALKKLN